MIKKRNIALCVVLSIVTCGIYGIYWFIVLTNDTNAVSEKKTASGGVAFLLTLVTLGIYGLYWAYKCGVKLDDAKLQRGQPASNGGILYLILFLLGGIIAYALIQNELNKLAEE